MKDSDVFQELNDEREMTRKVALGQAGVTDSDSFIYWQAQQFIYGLWVVIRCIWSGFHRGIMIMELRQTLRRCIHPSLRENAMILFNLVHLRGSTCTSILLITKHAHPTPLNQNAIV